MAYDLIFFFFILFLFFPGLWLMSDHDTYPSGSGEMVSWF